IGRPVHYRRNICLEKFFGYMARVFRIVILLEPPIPTKHPISFRKVISTYNGPVMLSRKQKRLVLPLAQNPPHALILVRSLGMRRTGRVPLYQYSTVFRNNQKDVSSVKSVRFQLSSMCL